MKRDAYETKDIPDTDNDNLHTAHECADRPDTFRNDIPLYR